MKANQEIPAPELASLPHPPKVPGQVFAAGTLGCPFVTAAFPAFQSLLSPHTEIQPLRAEQKYLQEDKLCLACQHHEASSPRGTGQCKSSLPMTGRLERIRSVKALTFLPENHLEKIRILFKSRF